MELIDRALDVEHRVWARTRNSCELLGLIRGLQSIGVEVRIWSRALDAKRAKRVAPDAPDLTSEAFIVEEANRIERTALRYG